MNSNLAYKPPYTLSETAVSLIADIAAALERYKIVMAGPDGVRLRKINHVKTIRGTEGNTLTEEQVTAVLEGKRVAAPRREINEIKGAHAAYKLLEKIDSYSLRDVQRVHATKIREMWYNFNGGER